MTRGVLLLLVSLASPSALAEECGPQGCDAPTATTGGMGLLQKKSNVERQGVAIEEDEEIEWINSNDGTLDFKCDSGGGISRLVSTHHNGAEDRRWTIECSDTNTEMSSPSQTGWVNDWDNTLDYTCPSDSVMTGLYSVHNNKKEDRRWKISCAQVTGAQVKNGGFSGWVNDWDGDMNHGCSSGSVVVGVYSVHNNKKEDRRWKVKCGDVVLDTAAPTEAPTPEATTTAAPSKACVDGDGDSDGDVYDYHCDQYDKCLAGDDDGDYTHEYDDDDFTAMDMCCNCKGEGSAAGAEDGAAGAEDGAAGAEDGRD